MIPTVKTTNAFANVLTPVKPVSSPEGHSIVSASVETAKSPLPHTKHYLAAFTPLQFGQNEKQLGNNGEFTLNLSAEQLEDILTNKTRTIELNPITDYNKLSTANKRALVHLVKAAEILNEVFLQQDHPENVSVKAALEKATKAKNNKLAKDTLKLFTMFNGLEGKDLYAKESKPLNLFQDQKLGPGKGFYRTEPKLEDLAKHLTQHPEDASAFLGNNTIVKWDGRELITEPYSVFFRTPMKKAAKELLLAAQATDHPGLANYLTLQAQALTNDSDPALMLDADKAWLALKDSPLEVTIARECYDDRLSPALADHPEVKALLERLKINAKAKDSIGVRVGIVNLTSRPEIDRYLNEFKAFRDLMPMKEQYTQPTENKMAVADVDLVALSGQYAKARDGLTVAQNLPNDDKLAAQLQLGSRLVFHRQIRQSVDPQYQQAFLEALVDPTQRSWYHDTADFRFTIGHEMAHSLGPLFTQDHRNKISALGLWGDMLEENKADVASLVMTDYLVTNKKLTSTEANEIYLTWAVGELPTKKPSPDEAHSSRSLMQLNYFREKGAIHLEKGHPLRIVPDKMADTAKQMLQEVIQLQLDGNSDNAEAFVKKYTVWNDALDYVVEERLKLNPKRYKFLKQTLRDKLLRQYDKLSAAEKQLH